MKIGVTIKKDKMIIELATKDYDYNLNCTNVIDVKTMCFSDDFILENAKLIGDFINTVCVNNDVTTAVIKSGEVCLMSMNFLVNVDVIDTIVFDYDCIIDYEVYKQIRGIENIKNVECFDMKAALFDEISKTINVKTKKKVHSVGLFMKANKMNSYSDIYYKKEILISDEMIKESIGEINYFWDINKTVGTVRVKFSSLQGFKDIIDIFKDKSETNIHFIIEKDEDNNQLIDNNLPFIKKELKERKIDYSIDEDSKNKRASKGLLILVGLGLLVIIGLVILKIVLK